MPNKNRNQNTEWAEENPESAKPESLERSEWTANKEDKAKDASNKSRTTDIPGTELEPLPENVTPNTKNDDKSRPSGNRDEHLEKKIKILCWNDVETENIPNKIKDICQVEQLKQLSEKEICNQFLIGNPYPIFLCVSPDIALDLIQIFMYKNSKKHEKNQIYGEGSHAGSSRPYGGSSSWNQSSLSTAMEYTSSNRETDPKLQSLTSKEKNQIYGEGSNAGSSRPYGGSSSWNQSSLSTAMEYTPSNRETDPKLQSLTSKGEPTGKKNLSSQTIGRRTLGIFSRAAEKDFSWLKTLLKKNGIRVECFYIATNTFENFRDDIMKCNFGILYHSANSGRLNVTDVTDSMYDHHLVFMSNYLGKNNVMVVLDDLQDSSSKEKIKILTHQPTIGQCASHLILINLKEKNEILTSHHSAKAKEVLNCLSIGNKSTFSLFKFK